MLFSRKFEGTVKAREQRVQPVPALAPAQPHDRSGAAGGGNAATQSFIDASLTIVGDLRSAGDLRIDGRVCGNVRCAQLIVGRGAAITGTVVADQTIVRGRVTGTIRSPVVIIQETAHVESEIAYGSLAIDEGAFFEGTAHRRDNPLAQEPALPLPVSVPEPQVAQAASDGPPARAHKAAAWPALLEPPAAGGAAPMPNGHAPATGGRTPSD